MEKFEVECANQTIDADFKLDIFQQTPNTHEPMAELVTKGNVIFKHNQVDSKKIKCLFQWWAKHEALFPTIGFLVCQILGICRSQIETKRIFSLARIFTN
jgi:hypothetical protein